MNGCFAWENPTAHKPPVRLWLDTSTTGEDVCPGWVEEEDVGTAFYEIVEGYAVLVIWKKTVQERKRERERYCIC